MYLEWLKKGHATLFLIDAISTVGIIRVGIDIFNMGISLTVHKGLGSSV